MSTFRFSTMGGEVFELDLNMIKLSTTLKTMLDNLGCEGSDEVISLTKINSEIMSLIVNWMKHHADNKEVDTASNNRISEVDDYVVYSCDDIDPWDEKLLESLDMATIFQLSMACNYLDIKGLLGSTCKFIASKIKGKEPAEIRQVFNIPEAKSDKQSASPMVTDDGQSVSPMITDDS